MLSEISQTRKGQIQKVFPYLWNLKNKTNKNEQTKSRTRPVNTENKLMVARGEASGERHKTDEGEWEI